MTCFLRKDKIDNVFIDIHYIFYKCTLYILHFIAFKKYEKRACKL